MSDETETLLKSGWFVALATSTWGIFLHYIVGRYVKAGERLESRLASMEGRLASIEARSYQVRKED